MGLREKHPYIAALEWQIEAGADEAISDSPVDRTAAASLRPAPDHARDQPPASAHEPAAAGDGGAIPLGSAQARAEAARIAGACANLEELQSAIAGFEGLAIRNTAKLLVFAAGRPGAHIMVIGDAPGTEEDRSGVPFTGPDGRLLDKILGSIGLSRNEDDPARAAYLTNLLNWRPPGNRTPSQAEIDISLTFIERHITLAAPRLLILCGGVVAKALLGTSDPVSRLRGRFHDYKIAGAASETTIPALVTCHPLALLRTPDQKKLVWADMLQLRARLEQNPSG